MCCPFSHERSWMRSGTELSQLLIISYLLLSIKWNFVHLKILSTCKLPFWSAMKALAFLNTDKI